MFKIKLFSFLASFFVMFLMLIGCSASSSNYANPTSPALVKDSSIPLSEVDANSNRQLLDIGQVSFDVQSKTATIQPERDALWHFKVTNYLIWHITVLSYDPVSEVISVSVTISNNNKTRNPKQYGGYDLRLLIYTDDSNHLLINDESWTGLWDIPGGRNINPFKVYKWLQPRFFKWTDEESQVLEIKCPSSNFNVKFAIDASYPGNCTEPYQFDNFQQEESLYDQAGSSARLSVYIYDHQNDVNKVALECSAITGEPVNYFSNESENKWGVDIVNNVPAPAGEYEAILWATSTGSGDLKLYDVVSFKVEIPPCDLSVLEISGPNEMVDETCGNFSMDATCSENITYLWICDPPSAGYFDDPTKASVQFCINDFDCDSQVIIKVEVNCGNYCEPVLKSKSITIHAPLNVGDIIGPDTVDEGTADSTFSVDLEGGCDNYTYNWTSSNTSVADFSDRNDNPATLVTYQVNNDTEIQISAEVSSQTDGPKEVHKAITIINKPIPDNPVFVSSCGSSGENKTWGVDVVNGKAYLANRNRQYNFVIVDISNPENCFRISEIYVPGDLFIVDVVGNYAYCAAGNNGLAIVNVANPYSPFVAGNAPTGVNTRDIDIFGNYCYVVDVDTGLIIVNISSPSSPNIEKTVNLGIAAECGISIKGDYAYIAASYLIIVKINPPGSASVIATQNTGGAALGVHALGNWAYVAASTEFCTIDISNPFSPGPPNRVYPPPYGILWRVFVSNGYAYTSHNGLRIFDVTNPAEPSFFSAWERSQAYDVVVEGNYAYLASDDKGMSVIKLWE